MEYAFKNSPEEKVKKIVLNLTGFDLYFDGAKYTVSYSDINGVWLNKPGGLCTPSEYSCTLNINDRKPIYISSKNYDDEGNVIEQPNHYNSFVRVLHHHLQSKSRAQYRFGVQPRQYALRVLTIIGILTGFGASYLYLNINKYILALPAVLSIFVAVCGLKFCISNYPKDYKPENIPLKLLPSPITS